jgi:hypothetical protein
MEQQMMFGNKTDEQFVCDAASGMGTMKGLI